MRSEENGPGQSGVTIGDMTGGIYGSTIAGRDVNIYARSKREELGDYLELAVAKYKDRMQDAVYRPEPTWDQPYKFLFAFEIEDADIFFGREAASDALLKKVLARRMTVLHARSGAGKTSLLNAGLSPLLVKDGRLAVSARAYDDPVQALKEAIAPRSLERWPELLPELTLQEFLGRVCAQFDRRTRELVLILDQFEEFFVSRPEREQRQPFLDALGDCYDDGTLPVRFVIGIRGDYFTHLATLDRRLPHIFDNQYYLEAMSRKEAEAAITGPVKERGRRVAYQQELLDVLLDDLAGMGSGLGAAGGMELPHLQIICTRLYETLPKGQATITLEAYEEMGRARGVLGGYLQDKLADFSEGQQAVAREVLKALVSSQATRRVQSYDALAGMVAAGDGGLDDVLKLLANARLLRRVEYRGQDAYELTHEYLIDEIRTWMDPEEQEFRRLQELLEGGVRDWRDYGVLISRDRLELLYQHREQFGGLDEESGHCILQSALAANFAVEEWARLAGESGETLLMEALGSPVEETRRIAMRRLGAIWGLPEVSRLAEQDGAQRWRAAAALGDLGDLRAVQPLIAALGDQESRVRWRAAGALGDLGDLRAVEPLIAALRDRNRWVRWRAAEVLGDLGDPRAFEPLLAALGDQNVQERSVAARALGQLGGRRAVEPLIRALRDGHWNVRRRAAEALGRLGDPRAVEPLIDALEDGNPFVRRAAAQALGQLGDPRALERLRDALQCEDGGMRMMAAQALGQLGEPAPAPLIAALQDGDSKARIGAAQALACFGDARGVELLIDALEYAHPDVRTVAVGALGQLGDPRTVKPLIDALGDEDSRVVWPAAQALGQLGDARAVEPLIDFLKDAAHSARKMATWALGQLGDVRAVDPLIAALRDEDSGVRERAAAALWQLGELGPERLTGALEDGNATVRHWAAKALGQLGDPPAVEPLVAALGDEVNKVRAQAAQALGDLGDPRAFEPLIAALGDNYGGVRVQAAWALGRLGDARAVEELIAVLGDNWGDVREQAAWALGRLGDARAVGPLVTALGDQDPPVGAAWALGQLGDARAVEPLIDALKHAHPDVRTVAVGALGQLGDARAVEPLITVMEDEESSVRRVAAWALGQLGDPRAVEPLATALEDPEEPVRDAAAQALETIGTPEALAALETWGGEKDDGR
jgi:HEAT repeat protein